MIPESLRKRSVDLAASCHIWKPRACQPPSAVATSGNRAKVPGIELQKAHEFVEKVPNQELDKLPVVVISYRFQVSAREKRKIYNE